MTFLKEKDLLDNFQVRSGIWHVNCLISRTHHWLIRSSRQLVTTYHPQIDPPSVSPGTSDCRISPAASSPRRPRWGDPAAWSGRRSRPGRTSSCPPPGSSPASSVSLAAESARGAPAGWGWCWSSCAGGCAGGCCLSILTSHSAAWRTRLQINQHQLIVTWKIILSFGEYS